MAQPVESPAQVADRLNRQRMRGSDESIRASITHSFRSAVWLAQQAGAPLDEEILFWVEREGRSAVADWVDPSVTGFQLLQRWEESHGKRTPLLAALVQEDRLSTGAADLGPYFRSKGLTLRGCLAEARERVALAALDAAFAASWNRRMVFRHALGLARGYLDNLMELARLEGLDPKRALLARYGISTVLAARFGEVAQSELENACEALLEAHNLGADNALSYFTEGCLWRYDLFADRAALESAAHAVQTSTSATNKNATWYLNCAELWVKLAGEASRPACPLFLEKASHAVESARLDSPTEAETKLRIVMLEALIPELGTAADARENVTMRGLRFPFCLRANHTDLPSTLERVAPALISAISQNKSHGEFVFRDVLAELHSYLARRVVNDALQHLTAAIHLRDGGARASALRGGRVELAQAEDKLLLAALANRPSIRREAFGFLGQRSGSTSDDATKLVVMAQDVEERGPVLGPLLPIGQELALAARNGDSEYIFETAARQAISSHDLQRRMLGGRGSVVVLEDANQAVGQTFVFKQLSAAADAADRARTEALRERIRQTGESSRFGVIDHLTTIQTQIPGAESVAGQVVSVRRFSQGRTLDMVIRSSPARAYETIERAVEFLALFHATGAEAADGTRRCLREREVGRWLKSMYPDEERNGAFSAWWNCVEGAPMLERRDAHAFNWLADTEGRVLAVDLDARGTRPFGYELAQLVDDVPWLPPEDWSTRCSLLEVYLQALHRYGWPFELALDRAQELFGAGLIARALWLFSEPEATSESKIRAGRLIKAVARDLRGCQVGTHAAYLSDRWQQIAGAGPGAEELVLTLPERRRISRAMAFHLRHDANAPASKDGWVHVEELTQLLRSNGHVVTPDTLLLIAGAAGEPRFERDGMDIRAAYGHSVKTSIEYESRIPPSALYHATPLENLRSIFEARAGLSRGKRQWVHMSDRPSIAMNASARQKKPVALLKIKTDGLAGVVFASGNTWLAPQVPSSQLEIVTLYEERVLVSNSTTSSTRGADSRR